MHICCIRRGPTANGLVVNMCERFVHTVGANANSQRCLLCVQEIANHMEKDTETYEVVQEAIDTMQRVAWHINDMKRKHEHAVRLQVREASPHN